MYPKLFILSAPSGTGKTTIATEVIRRYDKIQTTISYTTREPRTARGEKDGVDYHFVSRDHFEEKIENGDFLEWANIYGNYYGTCKEQVEQILENKFHALMVIDTQGAHKIRKLNFPNSIFIYLIPPSIDTLRERLKKRGTESEENIELRLSFAKDELKEKDQYDYVIINDNIERAVQAFLNKIKFEENKPNSLI